MNITYSNKSKFFVSAMVVSGLLFIANKSEAQTPYQACAPVDAAGGNVTKGESKKCGDCNANGFNPQGCVKCNTVSLTVPSNMEIVSYRRTGDASYAAWQDSITIRPQPDGSTYLSTTLNNWSEDMRKNICLFVTAKPRS